MGQTAVTVPLAWLVCVTFFGFRMGNDAYPWTILPEPPGAPHAAAGAVLAFAAGLLALLRFPRTPA